MLLSAKKSCGRSSGFSSRAVKVTRETAIAMQMNRRGIASRTMILANPRQKDCCRAISRAEQPFLPSASHGTDEGMNEWMRG